MTSATPPRRSLLPLAIVGAAVASAVVLLVVRLRLEPPTVPTYVLDDHDAAEMAVGAGKTFRIDVEPTGEVTGAVGARGFLLRGDEVRPWDPQFEVARDGSVHLAGPVDTLFAGVPPGPWEVAVAVGRPENLPTAPRDVLLARDGGPAPAAWRLVRKR
ncbi:MAG: hypothetical protein ACRELB_22975, partial [Polyangiaceae bacterium]